MQLVRIPTLSQSEIICWLTPFSSSCACNTFLFPDWLLTHAASGGFKSVVGGARQCIKTKRLPPFALEYSSICYVWSRGSERRSSLCLPMSDSIFLSLSFLQEKSAGFQEKEFQVFKECFTSLRHLEIERKGLSHRFTRTILITFQLRRAHFRICPVLVGHSAGLMWNATLYDPIPWASIQ